MPTYEPFVPADDFLHDHDTHPWWAETWWFCFFVPEQGIGGWLYALVRPNQRASAGGAWVWDRSGSQPRTSPYFAHYTALPTRPERLHASPLDFPSPLTITTTVPGQQYGLVYDDADAGFTLDLDFAATMPAIGHKQHEPPFFSSAHYDQAGRVTGTVTLAGEEHVVDCFALRDRSWGLRSERFPPRFSYCWLATQDEAFLVYSERVAGVAPITRGFLYRDGECRPVTSGRRTEERDPVEHWVTTVHIEAVDEDGRTIDETARARSRLVHPRPTSANTISLLEFDRAGGPAWGEDQDVWTHTDWRSTFLRPDGAAQ
ncbi:hypothetical protein [uncultured Jatrophihabitans sp.]|uniref:DUF7065 domain-containing protein n=1 Tax=uncultured Jatrophihabitans sp. TaxID=1610747 RepID=UPI0035C949ED